MKKCVMPFRGANNYGKSLTMVVFFLLFSSFTSAQTAESIASREKPAIVKHAGTLDDNIYFQVQLNNDSSEKFIVTSKDNDGTILFREMYQDKNFDKKFRFNKEEINQSLTFTIRKVKDNQTQTFKINYNTHFTEEVVITRL